MPMKQPLRMVLVLVAAILHLGAPVAAYAAMRADTRNADFCSVAGPATPASAERRSPAPMPHEYHCAHAPCCAGGAVGAAAPPPHVQSFIAISFHRESVPADTVDAAPVSPIAAAQPRGPPLPA